MIVDLPLEQWKALDTAAQRNMDLLILARTNIALAVEKLALEEAAKAARPGESQT